MKILIIGGHGFVGKNLVNVLNNTEHQVHPLSRRDGLDLTNYDDTKHFIRDIFSSLKKLNKKPKEIVQILNSTFKKDKLEESTILNFEYYSLLID